MDLGAVAPDLVLRGRIIRQLLGDPPSLGRLLATSRTWRRAWPFTIAVQAIEVFETFGIVPATVLEPQHLPAFLRLPLLVHMRRRLTDYD